MTLALERNTGDHRLGAVSDGPLVVGKEERLVVADRAAEGSAELVVAKRVLGLVRAVGEKIGRIQRVVPEKLEQRFPCHLLVPDFDCRLMTPPATSPNSAE